jgi:hypothetical protein
MNEVLFYHDDPDGWTAGAIVASRVRGIECLPINYDQPFPWSRVRGADVWMVDFSLQPFSLMERLAREAGSLTWIDHHVSAIDEARSRGFDVLGVRLSEVRRGQIEGRGAGLVSGCELTWWYCYPDRCLPEFVEVIGRFDVGNFGDGMPLRVKLGFEAEGEAMRPSSPLPSGWDRLLFASDPFAVRDLESRGGAIEAWRKVVSARDARQAVFPLSWKGRRWLAVNGRSFDGLDLDGYDGALSFWYSGPSGGWKVGLLSADPEAFSVAALCKEHGGGGHDAVGGFMVKSLPFALPLKRLAMDEWIEEKLRGGGV